MINVQVTGVSQEFNFSTKRQETFALFVLPNGHSFRAPVDDETAQMMMTLAVTGDPTTPLPQQEYMPAHTPTMPAPPNPARGEAFEAAMSSDGVETHVFGGQDDSPADPGNQLVGGDAINGVPPGPIVRPRLIGKDSHGYPIMSGGSGVDPAVVTGSIGDGDEDGVRPL